MLSARAKRRNKVRMRIRKTIRGNAQTPRLCVFRSNKQIYAQIIDDVAGNTLAAASSRAKDILSQKVKKTDQAKLVGTLLAQKAVEAGIKTVVFDRGGYLFHGRVKALADAAREGGIKF